jgi:hypothetical protein
LNITEMKAEMKEMQKELSRLSTDLEGMFPYTCSFRLQIFFGSRRLMMLEALPRWALLLRLSTDRPGPTLKVRGSGPRIGGPALNRRGRTGSGPGPVPFFSITLGSNKNINPSLLFIQLPTYPCVNYKLYMK